MVVGGAWVLHGFSGVSFRLGAVGMIIRSVKLMNFRSHESFVLECNPHTTTIVGENGCGKTSVLEAIYEALRGKSFRAVDREIVRRGAEFYRVELEYEDGRKTVVVYDGQKKEFVAEDKKTRRLPKKSQYPIVLFEPDDLHLVGASPTSRRMYFDRMFSQLSDSYGMSLARYNKVLKQRNELLKKEDLRAEDLFAWDVLMTKHGAELAKARRDLVKKINEKFTETYRTIAQNADEVELKYSSEVESESEFLRILERDFERDLWLGHTGYGVHHDNYEFIFNKVKADGSASRGEVRSSVLALKFIEAEMILKVLGRKPVVLLDDVFSELDEMRQKCLVQNFRENQVILTSVGSGELECGNGEGWNRLKAVEN